jgi:hypothetical protein
MEPRVAGDGAMYAPAGAGALADRARAGVSRCGGWRMRGGGRGRGQHEGGPVCIRDIGGGPDCAAEPDASRHGHARRRAGPSEVCATGDGELPERSVPGRGELLL